MIVDIGKSDVVVTNLYQYDYGQSMDFSGGQMEQKYIFFKENTVVVQRLKVIQRLFLIIC